MARRSAPAASRRDLLSSTATGVAAFPDQGAGLDEIAHRADMALYAAKRRGRVVCAVAT